MGADRIRDQWVRDQLALADRQDHEAMILNNLSAQCNHAAEGIARIEARRARVRTIQAGLILAAILIPLTLLASGLIELAMQGLLQWIGR